MLHDLKNKKIGLVVSPSEYVTKYFPTSAEPDLIAVEPPFSPDDQLIVDAMRQRGAAVRPVVWGEEAESLGKFDVIVFRSPWDYIESDVKCAAFIRWIKELKAAELCVENNADLMLWLLDKSYLRDFETQGVPVVPTEIADLHHSVDLITLQKKYGQVIVKPCISAAGRGLAHLSTEQAARDFHGFLETARMNKAYALQPLISGIATRGEWSLIYIDGRYSHAVQKIPAAGKVLCQAEQGGSVRFTSPPPSVRSVGDATVEAIPGAFALSQRGELISNPLYLRIDVIDDERGPLLSECEGVEPDLFFRAASVSINAFCEALAGRLGSRVLHTETATEKIMEALTDLPRLD